MTTPTPTAPRPQTVSGLVPYRLSVRQVERMLDAGVFPDGSRFELIDGRLVQRTTKHEPHNFCVDNLAKRLETLVRPLAYVREEKSLKSGRWHWPEPDIHVVRGRRADYRAQGPRARDVPLIIEVADTTYAKYRGRKWRLYALVGIPAYRIVRLPERVVEVYVSPHGRGRAG